ncbi:CstA-like transporter-associated (seleno)protein [Streptomyces canus]|uniref:CstA-like transporter-associated (seleno)protein n=1 Tax=Streptomyces canus TaxID=58343 RepID=UPI003F56E035
MRRYVRELTDESAYDRYVAHVRQDHPQAPGSPPGLPLLLIDAAVVASQNRHTDMRTRSSAHLTP